VTHVLQVGLTDREQYIHRLGRTARVGKCGEGLILLAPFEVNGVLNELKDMKLQRMTHHLNKLKDCFEIANYVLSHVSKNSKLSDSASKAYKAWLGFYNSNLRKCKFSPSDVV